MTMDDGSEQHPLVSEKDYSDMYSGDGSNVSTSSPTVTTSNFWNSTDIFMTGISTTRPNGGLIFGIIVAFLIFITALVLVYRRRKLLKKRRNNPYHVPIIEYKEDNISVSTFSSVGYGTYRDLEEYPTADDVPQKIEGKLTLQGLYDPETTT